MNSTTKEPEWFSTKTWCNGLVDSPVWPLFMCRVIVFIWVLIVIFKVNLSDECLDLRRSAIDILALKNRSSVVLILLFSSILTQKTRACNTSRTHPFLFPLAPQLETCAGLISMPSANPSTGSFCGKLHTFSNHLWPTNLLPSLSLHSGVWHDLFLQRSGVRERLHVMFGLQTWRKEGVRYLHF